MEEERSQKVRLKIERANEHFRELQSARQAFLDSGPCQVESSIDPDTGYKMYRVTGIQAPPAKIGIIAGDVIHNLRSALDYLAWQLVLANDKTPTKQTAFPIYDDAAKYRDQRARQVEGMAQSAKDLIDATEPYRHGGGAGLWVIHHLDIEDKHHALLVTLVSLTGASFSLPGWWEPEYSGAGGISLPGFSKALEDGDVIATREIQAGDIEFRFDVGLIEPDVIRGKSLIKTFGALIDLVLEVVARFEPLLS